MTTAITYAPDADRFRGTCWCGQTWVADSFGAAADLGEAHASMWHREDTA